VTEIDNAGTPDAPHVVLQQAFDLVGNRLSVSATVDSIADYVNTYQYDALNRTTQVTQAGQSGGNAVAAEKRASSSPAGHVGQSFLAYI